MNTDKRIGFYVEIGVEERRMLDVLKKKHSVNLSQLVRNLIKEAFERVEGGAK
jgi:hypothetical protein